MRKPIDTWDWQAIFELAVLDIRRASRQDSCSYDTFTREDVVGINAIAPGDGRGLEWLIFVRLNDSRYAFITACCPNGKWEDEDASACCFVSSHPDTLRRLGLDEEARRRLKLTDKDLRQSLR